MFGVFAASAGKYALIAALPLTLPATHHIQPNSSDEDRAFDDVLHEIADIEQRHSVVEAGHDEGSETGSEDGTAAAHQAGSADDTGGDGVEFFENTGVRGCAADAGGEDE